MKHFFTYFAAKILANLTKNILKKITLFAKLE